MAAVLVWLVVVADLANWSGATVGAVAADHGSPGTGRPGVARRQDVERIGSTRTWT